MYRYISEQGFKTPAIINSLKIFVRDFKDVSSIQATKLNSEEIASALEIHSLQWHPTKDTTRIKKEFKFNSFKKTFAFMGSISAVAEEMHHYPKWTQKENVVNVEITTNDCSGISVKDILLAFTMDQLAMEIKNTQITSVCDSPKVVDSQILNAWNQNFSKTEEILQNLQRNAAQL
ncbi:unnamed protein product [Paramecium octaurelia]|uniref:4-alpha-hydroxy-tetrahydropterin dehydratase n=1 Tax=Paramecium octaurelia TaxID=43137 RepID=A0A8S1UAX0_PAROT|nr:unnamed protein product [Paramecium octaurelia]